MSHLRRLAAIGYLVMGTLVHGMPHAFAQTQTTSRGGTITVRRPVPPIEPSKDREAERAVVPGTGVSLVPPPGAVQGPDFPGFSQCAAEWGIVMVTVIPAPYELTVDIYRSGALAPKGIVTSVQVPHEFGGSRGTLFEARQPSPKQPGVGYMGVWGDDNTTVTVFAFGPAGMPQDQKMALRASVLSARTESTVPSDPMAMVSHSVTPPPSLKYATTIAFSVMYTSSGSFAREDATEPTFTSNRRQLARSVPAPVREQMAREQFTMEYGGVRGRIESSTAIEIGGFPAVELTGTAVHLATGERVSVYVAVVFEPGAIGVMDGNVGGPDAAQWIEVFRRTAATYRPKADSQAAAPTP